MTVRRYFQGARLPNLVTRLVYTDPTCPAQKIAHDLAGKTVRALFYKATRAATSNEACGASSLELVEDQAIFYREATILSSDLLEATAVDAVAPALPEELDPSSQPQGPQRLSVVVSGFVQAGNVVLTGTDAEDADLEETVPVAGAGTTLTSAQFKRLNLVTVDGEFTVQITVPNGRVRVAWQQGDLALVGNHALVMEIHDGAGLWKAALDPILIQVVQRRQLPLPVVTDATPDPVAPSALLTVTGTGFLDATLVEIVNQADNVALALTGLTINSATELEATVPGAAPLGTYWVRVTGPGGSSVLFDGVDVA